LQRFYISRLENAHTVPAILEKMARALEVRIYALFYDGEKPPADLPKPNETTAGSGRFGRDARTLGKFRRLLSQIDKADVNLLLFMAQKMAKRTGVRKRSKTVALGRFFPSGIVEFPQNSGDQTRNSAPSAYSPAES
jgi:hypothetical protein